MSSLQSGSGHAVQAPGQGYGEHCYIPGRFCNLRMEMCECRHCQHAGAVGWLQWPVRAVVVFLRVSATCEWQRVNVGIARRWHGRLASKAAFSELPLCFYWQWCRYDAVVAICDLCFFVFPVSWGGGLPRILVQMVSSARVRMASNGPISRAKGRVVVR